MTGKRMLEEASNRGIILEVRGSSLHFRGLRAALTKRLREELASMKQDIIAILESPREHNVCAFFCGNPMMHRYCRKCGGTWQDYVVYSTGRK